MKLRHVCEVCGREEVLTPEEAFEAGWDYPPKMGTFGIVSPRTCPNCLINQTVWWEIVTSRKSCVTWALLCSENQVSTRT